MKRLTRQHFTTTLDPQQPLAITIESGEELVVETWDAFMGHWENPSEDSLLGPATGPIYVNGASRGDSLRVDVLSIDVAGEALHTVRPGKGFLADRFDRLYPTVMALQNGYAHFRGDVKIPLRPSVGLIAASPGRPQSTASDNGPYGGDIDVKEFVAGSTIWLPVYVDGALLVLGDVHAVVGDGAVGGTGAEVDAQCHIRVNVERHKRLHNPRLLTPDYFITLASARRSSTAMKQAVREMVAFLVDEKGMDPYDAYSLLSLAGDVRISRTFRPISPCKMMLARSVFDQLD